MEKIVKICYDPQPKQAELHSSPANEILYGGAAGPGKSMALRFEALMWCLRIPNLQVYLFRRTFPELEKNHILPALQQFPQEKSLLEYKKGDKRWEFRNGSMLHFCHCQYEQDVFQYQGAEIHLLLIDELTTFTEFIYDYLRGRVRCALTIPKKYKHKIPGIECASNPGGVGHNFCKERWVDFAPPMEVKRATKKQGGMLRQYIPGLLQDNEILMEEDPNYIHRLDALPEPYRTAYKDGKWDIFLGQAFSFSIENHVITPILVPENAPIYMTFDWGFGAPFSIGWWWVDADGRLIRFSEWYGWTGEINKGLRLVDSQIAEGIKEREKQRGIKNVLVRLTGHDSFNRKPDYKGGGQGKTTSEVFAEHGLYLSKADPSRELKIRQFRERLKVVPGERPMLQVYSTCEQFIRTVPMIQTDPHNIEYVDSSSELHCFDDAAQLCMYRPLSLRGAAPRVASHDQRLDALKKGETTPFEDQAREQLRQSPLTQNDYEWGEEDEYDDSQLYETI